MSYHDNACYIGIDLGTSGCRAMAVDAGGAVLAAYLEDLPASTRNNLFSEQSPQDWWNAVCKVLSSLIRRIPARNVEGIAVDGTSGTVFLVDDNGTPLGPALMYDDSRCQNESTRIASVAPDTSGAHGSASGLAKLLYLQQQASVEKARYIVHQADWINGRLCGQFGISDENNCLKLGYDPVSRQWPEWLTELGVNFGLLPDVVPAGTKIGTIDKVLATQFRLPSQTRIIAGTTDGVAGFLATGAHAIGDAVTSLGSTLVLKILADKPVFSPPHGVYSHRLGNQWLAGGASNCGGKTLLHYFTQQQLDQMTPLLQPDQPTGLDYYPLPAQGERFPFNDPVMQPRLSPRPADDVVFFQGILEGIAQVEIDGYRLLSRLGAPFPSNIYTVGGGARNQAWTRIREAMLNMPIKNAVHNQAAYGAALLARNACLNASADGTPK